MDAATLQFDVLPPEALGLAYERRLSSRARASRGAFYTPAPVIDYLIERTIGRLGDFDRPVRVLDPACGGGWFLLAALRRLSAGRDTKCRLAVLRDSIFGIDVDPGAVDVTRQALGMAVSAGKTPPASVAAILKRNIRLGDALLDPFGAWEHSFDLVLGNPPYLSYSGRQAVPLPGESEQHFRRQYLSARGWMTAHGLFVEKSLRDFSRRMVAFVLPDQVGHLEGYRSMREVVGELSSVAEVRYWGESVFDRAVTPVLTLIADARHDGPATIIDRDGNSCARILHGGEAWEHRRHASLLAKLFRNARTLDGEVADPGVHTGNCGHKLVAEWPVAAPVPTGRDRVLEGKQVGRYSCAVPTKSLRLDYEPREGEYYSIRSEQRYRQARYLIRQTAAHPIVGPRRHAVYFRNSLLALYPPTDGTDVRFLVGLLNSRLLRFAYQSLVRESRQVAFPQVKVGSLRKLPIRRIATAKDRAVHDRIVATVCRLLSAKAKREPDGLRIAQLDSRLDRLVYDLYGLTELERAAVEEATR